ncbi:MAG: ATP-binding cassette domain-containing protein [Burkholderiales bacterium]|nr:ATP-binding cassette domain-containing protein [Burkholderiales bacterium]
MLRLEGLRKTFNPGAPNQKVALERIDLALEEGEFGVVIGSNGAGKSTLLNVVAGDLAPDAGRVVIGGEDVTGRAAHERGRFIGRVFQDTSACTAPGLSIEENLAIAEGRGRRRRLVSPIRSDSRERFRRALEPLGLGLEERLETRVDLLSGGQRQAVSLVMALLGRPRLLALDEHTAALDPRTAEVVMRATVEAVERTRVTTLMVTHNMQQAIAHGDRLVMLHEGRVLFEATGAEKRRLTVDALVKRFGIVDDELLLA